jgi:hypothetical protein
MRAQLIRWSCATVLLAGMIATVQPAQANHQPRATPSATSIVGSPVLQPTIDLLEAQEIALEGQGRAHVTQIDLAAKDGVLVYRIALDNGIDVEVDATTGEMLRTEHDAHANDTTAVRQAGDDNEATAARRSHHHDADRSARRGDRDDDDERARRAHHDHDDRSARPGHHDHDAEVAHRDLGDPASTRIIPGAPPRERSVGARRQSTECGCLGCTPHLPASSRTCPACNEARSPR